MEKTSKKRGTRKNKFTAESIAVLSRQIIQASARVDSLNAKLESDGFDGEVTVDAGKMLVTSIEVIEDWVSKIEKAVEMYYRKSDRASAGVPEPFRAGDDSIDHDQT